MPFRIHFLTAGCSLGLALLAGCAAPPGAKVRPADHATAGPRGAAREQPAADYSAKAVAARTESHARYASAILHDLNDETAAAAEDFFKAAMTDLANEPLVLEVSERLLRAKKNDRAIELLNKAASRPDASGSILARLGLAYSMAGKKDLAIETNRQAIKKAPGTFSAYQYLAQLHLQNGEIEPGLKILDEALKQPHSDATFLVDLADTYLQFARAGKLEPVKARILEALQRAAAQRPATALLMQRLADGFAEAGERGPAAVWYTRLLDRFPHFSDARGKLLEIYFREQDYTNALPHLEALVREVPTNPQYHFQLGTLYFNQRKMKEAAESFRRTMLLAPSFERVYYDLAAAQINLDQAGAALETLARAREKFPPSFTGEYYAGQAYGRTKDYPNALKHYTAAEIIGKATATNELTPGFYFQIGAASERTQKFKEAEEYFRKCIELAPDFAEALNYLGYMWAERGENLPEARTMIERALKLEPKNGAFLDSLGWVLYKLDQPQEALKVILEAIEQTDRGDAATLYDHLGDIHAALKNTDQAREAWQKALALEPSAEIQKKLGPSAGAPDPPPAREPR